MVALRALRCRQIATAFRVQGATSGEAAKMPRDVGLRDGWALRSMIASTVLRRSGPTRYFLDEGEWARRRRRWRGWALRVALMSGLALATTALVFARH